MNTHQQPSSKEQLVEKIMSLLLQDGETWGKDTRAEITTLLTSHSEAIRERVIEIVEDRCHWYNTNNQIPDSELGKSEEHWDMLRKIVYDSLAEVEQRIKDDILALLTDEV